MIFLILASAGILAYFPVLLVPRPVNPDAQFIVPYLRGLEGPQAYFLDLLNLRTIDVQPVRDASLAIDLWIYEMTGLNSMVLHNLLLWCLVSVLFTKIAKLESRASWGKFTPLWLGLLLVGYPLFSQTIAWGVARKHILATLFALLASQRWNLKKNGFCLFYGLSVFSQPITLLLPFWALGRGLFEKETPRVLLRRLAPAMGIFLLGALVNTVYYTQSPVFRTLFGSKTNEAFSFSDQILAWGHYSFQLFFPFLLSQVYTLGHWSVFLGLGILLLLLVFLRKQIRSLTWLLFAVLPLAVVLVKPKFLYDTYLLLPALGVGLSLLSSIQNFCLRSWALIPLALMFTWTFFETGYWRSDVSLLERSFQRRPSCQSAFQFLRVSYENGHPIADPAARSFLRDHDCRDLRVPGQHLVNVEAGIAYYEEDAPVHIRIARLRELSKSGIYPHLAAVALMIKEGNVEEARRELEEVDSRWGKVNFREEHIPFTEEIILPFCRQEKLLRCQELIAPFIQKPDPMTYR